MTIIKQTDFIQSITDALQYISYYHPTDYIQALGEAYKLEESLPAKDAIAQILTNSRLCAEGKRPICQDTGIVVAFVKIGMKVRFKAELTVEQMVNEGVRRAYLLPDNKLRASIVSDPAGKRQNTKDNSPAITHIELVLGDTLEVTIAAKGGGSENKAKLAMLNPNDSIVDWVLEVVPTMGAGWCPPGMLGIGIGGTAEKAMLLAKESLMQPINMHALKAKGAQNRIEELRLEIYEKVNNLGIGAQGLGGLTTVLDVKILDYPTHAASLPVAIIPNCAATRHVHFTLDGSGAALLTPPDISEYPDVHWQPSENAKRVNLDTLTHARDRHHRDQRRAEQHDGHREKHVGRVQLERLVEMLERPGAGLAGQRALHRQRERHQEKDADDEQGRADEQQPRPAHHWSPSADGYLGRSPEGTRAGLGAARRSARVISARRAHTPRRCR